MLFLNILLVLLAASMPNHAFLNHSKINECFLVCERNDGARFEKNGKIWNTRSGTNSQLIISKFLSWEKPESKAPNLDPPLEVKDK